MFFVKVQRAFLPIQNEQVPTLMEFCFYLSIQGVGWRSLEGLIGCKNGRDLVEGRLMVVIQSYAESL